MYGSFLWAGRFLSIGQKSILPTKPKISRLITRRLIECRSSLLHLLRPISKFAAYLARPGLHFDAMPPSSLFLSLAHHFSPFLSHSPFHSFSLVSFIFMQWQYSAACPPAALLHFLRAFAPPRPAQPLLHLQETLLLFLHLFDPLFPRFSLSDLVLSCDQPPWSLISPVAIGISKTSATNYSSFVLGGRNTLMSYASAFLSFRKFISKLTLTHLFFRIFKKCLHSFNLKNSKIKVIKTFLHKENSFLIAQ